MYAALAEVRGWSSSPCERRLDRPPRIGQEGRDPGERLVAARRRGRGGSRRPAARGSSSPSDFASRGSLPDRPGHRPHSARRAPPTPRPAPRAADCRPRDMPRWSGSNSSTRPKRARKPAVSGQFSPLMSWTMQLPGHVSRRRHHQAHPLARPGRRETQNMLGAIMPQIALRQARRA